MPLPSLPEEEKGLTEKVEPTVYAGEAAGTEYLIEKLIPLGLALIEGSKQKEENRHNESLLSIKASGESDKRARWFSLAVLCICIGTIVGLSVFGILNGIAGTLMGAVIGYSLHHLKKIR